MALKLLKPQPASAHGNSLKLLTDAVRTLMIKKAKVKAAEEDAKAATAEVELLSGLVPAMAKADCKPVEIRGVATLNRTYFPPQMGIDEQKLIEVLSKIMDGARALKIVEMTTVEKKKGYSFLAIRPEKA